MPPLPKTLCALWLLSLGNAGDNLGPMCLGQHLPREREATRATMFSLQALEILLLGSLGRCHGLLTDPLLFNLLAFLVAWALNIPQISFPPFLSFLTVIFSTQDKRVHPLRVSEDS